MNTIPEATNPTAPTPQAQITALKSDTGFTQRLMSGDVAAKTQWADLHKAAAGDTPAAPAPNEQINALKNDPAFGAKLAAGDVTAKAEWDALHQAAYPDEQSAAAEIDAYFPVPSNPMEYDLSGLFRDERGNVGPNEAAADQATRQWLIDARLPKAIGSAIVHGLSRFQPQWQAMDENARYTHAEGVRAQIAKMWGADTAAARVAMAQQLVREVEKTRPGLLDLLERSGATSELGTVVHLGLHAERLFARRGITIESMIAKLKAKGS